MKTLLLLFVVFIASTSMSWAQEITTATETRWRRAAQAYGYALAQRGGRTIMILSDGPLLYIPFRYRSESPYSWMVNESILVKLQVSPDQYRRLKTLHSDLSLQVNLATQTLALALEGIEPDKRQEFVNDVAPTLTPPPPDVAARISEVVSPGQRAHLKRIQFRSQVDRVLAGRKTGELEQLMDLLRITKAQEVLLRDRLQAVRSTLLADITKVLRESNDKTVKVLTHKQRTLLKKSLGKEFKFSANVSGEQ